MPARECTYQDFLKCQPFNFNGTEGVVGLTHWFEKMEIVFDIINCPEKYQVKYTSCTLLNSALTWWNSHKRTIGNEAAYSMSWAELMNLMTEELIFLCTRMVPNEEDIVERFIEGLPDNIQRNMIAANPVRFQDVVRITNQLMDKKLQGYAARSAESKRRMESKSRDNRGQQPPFKRQNISGQNVVRAYTTRNNKRRGDCTAIITPNTQRAPVGNQQGVTGNQTGANEATAKAYAIGGGGTNPDSNVVTVTRCIDNLIVFSKLLAINGFEISLPVVVCFGVANALVQHYGALIMIQFLVNCQPLTDLRSLYQSRLLWTSQFLMSVRHGELMTICCVVAKPTLKQSFSTPLQLPDTQTIP
ncbi:hypothetical protein Tco_0925819 [Tanacetum coccineum]|uniref:Retrotransposon gag domain-containing protein n=1 Tax=Tanacetum coccineum TaxID=301880 RepID=A0ABQ5D7Y1_9ASTR